MSHRLLLSIAAAVACAVSLSGQTTSFPALLSLSPASAPVGTPGMTLTVTGTNFRTGSVVSWNRTILSTASIVGSTQLSANVPPFLLATQGSAIIVVVNPGGLQSNSLSFSIVGSPVTISTATVPDGAVGVPYSLAFAATGGTAPYTWTATSLPAGLEMSPAGVLGGTPTTTGTFNFTVRATDAGNQAASKAFSIIIVTPPLLISSVNPLPRGTVGQNYRHVFTATNGTSPYRWAVGLGLPAGLTFDATTGTIAGVPAASGAFTFPIRVTDARDVSATRTFELTVDPAPLTITTVSPLFSGTVGVAYAQTLSAAGGAAPYRWAIVSGDAGGLTLDATTGVLQGTPRTAGTVSFNVQVTDNSGSTSSRAFSIVINPPSLTVPTPATLPNGSVGVSYTQIFSVVGGTEPYIWSVVNGGVPGLTFEPQTATLSGTPTTAGTYMLTLTVRDAVGASTTRTFTVTINASALRITSETQLSDATLAAEFSQGMTATGGTPPYTWSATGLPEGLSIDSGSGVISGIPAVAGSYSFTVRVTDSVRATFIDLFRIVVKLPPAPGATISGLPAVAEPSQQYPLRVALNDVYAAPISGQAVLTFAPDSGGGDNTIQFASGGRTANFTIPAGSRDAESAIPLAIQTGTVAGTITVSLRLVAGGIDVTSTPAPTVTMRISRAAPVIRSTRAVRNGNSLSVEITGFSTAREVIQMSVTFSATAGQTLQNAIVTVPVESMFNGWFQDPASSAYGSQFFFSQSFTIQGDANAVTADSVTLTNRIGSVSSGIPR